MEKETLMPKARLLAQILKMASDPKSLQLELLHMICKKFPPFVEDSSAFGTPLDNVRVRCPCSQRHRVAPLGFLLLEQVEATLGSAEQIVDLVQTNLLEEPLMLGLSKRAVRQHGVLGAQGVLVTGTIRCNSVKSAEVFLSLAERCQKIYFQNLEVKEVIGERGWAMLRQALELPGRRDPDWNYCLTSTREAMVEGSKDDLRAIFERVHKWTVAFGEDMYEYSSDGAENEAWKILEATLDFWRQRIKARQKGIE